MASRTTRVGLDIAIRATPVRRTTRVGLDIAIGPATAALARSWGTIIGCVAWARRTARGARERPVRTDGASWWRRGVLGDPRASWAVPAAAPTTRPREGR